MDMKTGLEDCKKILKEHYGSQFRGLFLYGSMARGEAEKSSDIDIRIDLDL
jgi:predicted nucleotidyltransferase